VSHVTPFLPDEDLQKIGPSIYQYLGDRLGFSGKVIPPLAGLVAATA
jgi:hypothetical protein